MKYCPAYSKSFTMPFISHRTMLTVGVGESYVAEMIKDWEEKLPAHLKLAYLAQLRYGTVAHYRVEHQQRTVGERAEHRI